MYGEKGVRQRYIQKGEGLQGNPGKHSRLSPNNPHTTPGSLLNMSHSGNTREKGPEGLRTKRHSLKQEHNNTGRYL